MDTLIMDNFFLRKSMEPEQKTMKKTTKKSTFHAFHYMGGSLAQSLVLQSNQDLQSDVHFDNKTNVVNLSLLKFCLSADAKNYFTNDDILLFNLQRIWLRVSVIKVILLFPIYLSNLTPNLSVIKGSTITETILSTTQVFHSVSVIFELREQARLVRSETLVCLLCQKNQDELSPQG